MSLFFKPVLESAVEVPADLPEVNGEIGTEEIEQQVEDDRMDIVQAMHESDMEEIEHMKEVKDAEEAGASEEEIEKIEESWAIVREAADKGFFEKLKEKLKLLWAKIKEFFKSIFVYFKSLFMSAKDFVKEYEKDLQKLASSNKLSGYEYNGFVYTIDKVLDQLNKDHTTEKTLSTIAAGASADVNYVFGSGKNSDNDTATEYIQHELANYRSRIVTGSPRATYQTEDFANDLYSALRNGSASPKDTVTIKFNATEVIAAIYSLTEKQNSVKKISDIVDRNLKNMETELNKLENESFKSTADDKVRQELIAKRKQAANNALTYVRGSSAITTTTIGAVKVAISEQLTTLKRACAGAFTYARKQK